MTAGPLVSIVVATNRLSPFLIAALASASAQTYGATELIVVDDGSPGPSAVSDAARSVPDSRIIRITPSGVSTARNIGAEVTSGEYLVFLDDDDLWDPDRLAAQVAALEANPTAVASYCGMQVIDAAGAVLVPFDQAPVEGRLDIARGGGGIILPNLMLRRSAFVAVGGFHSRLRLAQDLDLTLRLAERGPFIFVDRPLVQYRAHSENNTNQARQLVGAIRRIVRLHLSEAEARGDLALVAALTERLRRNERYAWWRVAQSVRASSWRELGSVTSELLWALTTYPRGLAGGVRVRATRRFARAEPPRRELAP